MGIYLVREADAGGRFSWPGPDRLRPLTGAGWRQAQELAERLDGTPIDRIVSSPWLRCQQTVLPLAEARRLPIDSEPGLGVIASVDRALRLVAQARGETAFCTHPELLFAVIERLRRAGRRVRPLCGVAWTTDHLAPEIVAAG
jgi:broad specificity phosphatase PhoE